MPGTNKTSSRKRGRTQDLDRVIAPRTEGARAAAAWVESHGLRVDKPWYLEIALDVASRPAMATYSGDTDTRFHLNVYPEEWGVFFCHGSRASWIRVTDQPFVHGRDEYHLLGELPALAEIGSLVRLLEQRHAIAFQREHALVRTNLSGGKSAVRRWLSAL